MTSGPKPGAETTRIHMKYDAWNRQVKVSADDGNGSPGATIAEYRYDGLNQRIAKLIPNGESWDRTDFYYNEAWQCLEERYGANQAKETVPTSTKIQWLWSVQYIDAPVVRWRDTDDNGTLDETLYYCNDANMNVTALINTDGSIAERYVYDPYGKPTIYDDDWSDTVTWANSKKNEILYCGYRWDPESGLYNPRERYYHSTFGCMTTRDPSTRLDGAPEEANYRLILGAGRLTSIRSSEMPTYLLEYADGPSLYNYVANIPTARFDPSGLCGTVSGNTFTRDDTCCGPNITDLLSNMLQSLDTNWNNAWDWKKKNRICNGIWTPGKYQIPGGGEVNMWDVRELRNTPAEITSNVEGACPYSGECGNTVTVNGKCYDANQVNYILWGKINWLCGTKFEATIGAAAEYKLVSLGISKFKSDINFEVGHAVEALGWTTVGYMGNVTLGALVPSMHSECRVVDCKTKKQSLTPMLSEKGSSYVRYAIAAANILSDVSPLRVSPLLDPLLELQRTPSP